VSGSGSLDCIESLLLEPSIRPGKAFKIASSRIDAAPTQNDNADMALWPIAVAAKQ
jgi:hypothetical protein